MENDWISVEDKYPEKEGRYKVRFIRGSMTPKITEEETDFTYMGNMRPRFRGEMDWCSVTHWKNIENK
jgi:hypothetical protein